MTDKDPLDHFAEAISAHYGPAARRARDIERLATAFADVFSDASRRDGTDQALHMRLMDVTTQARALRARTEARYGPAAELFDRMQAHGGSMAARV